MRWDKTLDKIVKEICEEQGLPEYEVKEAIELSMKCVHTAMEHEEMPKILLRGLGTLRLIPRRLERKIGGSVLSDPQAEEKRMQNVERLKRILTRVNKEDEKIRGTKKHRKHP